jgi:hypothetical protein
MAITIISNFTSGKYYPSSNSINCTINSNNSGNCNFRYICDIYINGTKVFSDKIFPDPSTGHGFFQCSRVIQDYIQTSLPYSPYTSLVNLAGGASAPSSILSVSCKFGEEYDTSVACDGTVYQFTNLSTSNTFYVFEGVVDYEDYPTYTYTDYLIGTQSGTKKFLTNSPREAEVTYNDSYFLDFLSNATITGSYSLAIIATTNTGTYSATTTLSSLSVRRRYRLAVGPYDINKLNASPIINQKTNKYEVWLNYNGIQVSEKFTFNVKPPKTFQTRLAFTGLLGGIETFTFFHRNNKRFDVQRSSYEKNLETNISNVWKYRVGDRGTTTYKINAKETHSVSTYCNRDISEWLYEMWLSPDVWTFRRPELIPFRTYKDGSEIWFWLNDGHDLSVGDTFLCFPTTNSLYDDLIDTFTVVAVDGNKVDCNLVYSSWSDTEGACGWIQKVSDWDRLPVVISDSVIDVKQKTSKPIEYALNYSAAYSKNTLRG